MDFKIFKNNNIYKIILAKHGLLNPLSKHYTQNKEAIADLNQIKNLDSFFAFMEFNPLKYTKLHSLLKKDALSYTAYQYASIKY